MSELISGKEALIAFANGEKVSIKSEHWDNWCDLTSDFTLTVFSLNEYQFRLKPRTITLNGIEIPAPFIPKDGETIFIPANFLAQGYMECKYPTFEKHVFQFGVWRTEEEIKQVVAALRSIFSTQGK